MSEFFESHNESVFFDIHKDNPREGPGDNAATRIAFKMIADLPPKPKILDVGCGPGMQTIELAMLSDGIITAVDNYQLFLDDLNRRAQAGGFARQIKTVKKSMLELDFPEESFDLIWSEGAIFVIGFRKGLEEWKKFLKPGGYLAVTESVWTRSDIPAEIKDWWMQGYPAITTVEADSTIIKECGYKEIGNFILPASAWWNYYDPVVKKLPALKKKYANNPEALKTIALEELEIEMFRKYSDYYSYAFFIMQKTG